MTSSTTPPDSESLSFHQLGLAPQVLKAVDEVGYEVPSPIQIASIPPLLEGRDLVGQAQTGTGKTAAFALPLLSRLDLTIQQPQLLVLAPTRELALQVSEALKSYSRHLKGFRVLPIYGGQGMDTQLRQLRRGVHAIVGTPGRIQDHLRRGSLKLDQISAVVLDEADEMLRMGFIDDVDQILKHTPPGRQVALFSATMPSAIRRVAQRHLKDPVEIEIASKTATVSTVKQRFWPVIGTNKLDALTRILEVEDFDAMLVFVRTKTATVELSDRLEARGFGSAPLNGDMNQAMREKTVQRLKNGTLDIVVATDVAARGLDVDRISHVLNFDIPNDVEAYVHRIGRTGRAGRAGQAILFVSPREKRMLHSIERAIRQPIEQMYLPSRDDIAERRITQFKEAITEVLEGQDLSLFERILKEYEEESGVDPKRASAALAYLAQRDRPLVPKLAPLGKQFAVRPDSSGAPGPGRPASDRHGGRDGRDERRPHVERLAAEDSQRYRLEVGGRDGVQPKNIVGAIANEAALDARYIGRLKIAEAFTLVELPKGMPDETFEHLQGVIVCGRPLKPRVATEEDVEEAFRTSTGYRPAPSRPTGGKPRKSFDRKGGFSKAPGFPGSKKPSYPKGKGGKGPKGGKSKRS